MEEKKEGINYFEKINSFIIRFIVFFIPIQNIVHPTFSRVYYLLEPREIS